MSYIVIYEYFDDSGDYGGYWTDRSEEFDTYSTMIDYIAEMEHRLSSRHKWKYVLPSDRDILNVCWGDIDKTRKVLDDKKKEQDLIKAAKLAEIAREREARWAEWEESREKALLKELLEKYGDVR